VGGRTRCGVLRARGAGDGVGTARRAFAAAVVALLSGPSSSFTTSRVALLSTAWCSGSNPSCATQTRVRARGSLGGCGTAAANGVEIRKRKERDEVAAQAARLALGGAPYPLRSQLQGWPRAAASSHRAARPWRRRSEGAAFRPAYEARGAALWCCMWAESREGTGEK
jgi:hypothetical protein